MTVPPSVPARPLVHQPSPLPRVVAYPRHEPFGGAPETEAALPCLDWNSSTPTSRLAGLRQRPMVMAACREFHPLPLIYCAERPGPNGPPSSKNRHVTWGVATAPVNPLVPIPLWNCAQHAVLGSSVLRGPF